MDDEMLKTMLPSWMQSGTSWLAVIASLLGGAIVWRLFTRLRPVLVILAGIALWGLFLLPARAVVLIVMPNMEQRWPASVLLVVTAILAVVAVVRMAYPPEPLPPPRSQSDDKAPDGRAAKT